MPPKSVAMAISSAWCSLRRLSCRWPARSSWTTSTAPPSRRTPAPGTGGRSGPATARRRWTFRPGGDGLRVDPGRRDDGSPRDLVGADQAQGVRAAWTSGSSPVRSIELRIEARIRVSHAPRRVNLHLNTQRTTDFHSHLMEFDIPDSETWHTISMTTRDFPAVPGDTVFGQMALIDWGLEKYRVDVDYFKVDIVDVARAGPDNGAGGPVSSADSRSEDVPACCTSRRRTPSSISRTRT